MTRGALGIPRDRVEIWDYDTRWAILFAEERERVLQALAPHWREKIAFRLRPRDPHARLPSCKL